MATQAEIEAEARRVGAEIGDLNAKLQAARRKVGPLIVALARAGLTQGDLAELTGLTKLTVHRYERAGGIVRRRQTVIEDAGGAGSDTP